MEGCFMFQWGASFLSGGMGEGGGSWGSIGFDGGMGGFEKNCNDVSPTMGNPEQYPCANLLNCLKHWHHIHNNRN